MKVFDITKNVRLLYNTRTTVVRIEFVLSTQQEVSYDLFPGVRLSSTSLLLYNHTFPYTWNLFYDCRATVVQCCAILFSDIDTKLNSPLYLPRANTSMPWFGLLRVFIQE